MRVVGLLVPVNLLALLVALLGFHRKRRDRTGLEALQRDRLAGLLAIAVGVVLDSLQRRVDLGDQLALAVAGAQLNGAVGLRGGAVGQIRMIDVLLLQRLQGELRLAQNLVFPGQELGPEILLLPVVHKRLFFRRPVVLQLFQGQPISRWRAARVRPRAALYSAAMSHTIRSHSKAGPPTRACTGMFINPRAG